MIRVFWLSMVMLAVSACGADQGGESEAPVRLSLSRADTPEQTLALRLTVENTGRSPVDMQFRSAHTVEFVLKRGGQPVWRWSEGRMFAQMITDIRLPPGEPQSFTARVPAEVLSPGEYVAEAWLVGQPYPPASLTVKIGSD